MVHRRGRSKRKNLIYLQLFASICRLLFHQRNRNRQLRRNHAALNRRHRHGCSPTSSQHHPDWTNQPAVGAVANAGCLRHWRYGNTYLPVAAGRRRSRHQQRKLLLHGVIWFKLGSLRSNRQRPNSGDLTHFKRGHLSCGGSSPNG